MKKSYVDVFNPSGATTKTSENIMAPSLPPLPQSGFMVPSDGGVPQNQQQGVRILTKFFHKLKNIHFIPTDIAILRSQYLRWKLPAVTHFIQ